MSLDQLVPCWQSTPKQLPKKDLDLGWNPSFPDILEVGHRRSHGHSAIQGVHREIPRLLQALGDLISPLAKRVQVKNPTQVFPFHRLRQAKGPSEPNMPPVGPSNRCYRSVWIVAAVKEAWESPPERPRP
jgi:hypothetical protein